MPRKNRSTDGTLCPGTCRISIYLSPYYDGFANLYMLVYLGNLLVYEATHIVKPFGGCDIDANDDKIGVAS